MELKQNVITEEPRSLCKNCKGIDNCKQDNIGYVWQEGKLLKCDYQFRGGHNADIMKEDKYLQFECDNWNEIQQLFKSKRNLYVWGKTGRGKTHMEYHMANKYNKKGMNIYVELFSETMRKVKAEFDVDKTKVIVKRMKDTQILFIDDLGNEMSTKFSIQEVLINILNYRYEHNKPIVITSNYSLDNLFKEYNRVAGVYSAGQIVSRLKTFGVIEIKGKDWRE